MTFTLRPQPRILIITLRRLGDVLLTTPLIRTVRRAWPDATLNVLVFKGSEGILEGNPDIDRVLTLPERPSLRQSLAYARSLWREYDLAISTQTGDRPTLFAWAAGRRRAGLIPPAGKGGAWWKSRIYDAAVVSEPNTHRVVELLRIAGALGLALDPEIVPPHSPDSDASVPPGRYAVLHANPLYRFRRWTDDGWRGLARGLIERGLQVVVTQGPTDAERIYLDAIWDGSDIPVIRVKRDWPGLAALLKHAAVYIGPDTSVTHLAAGAGCPTVALYGPASPALIGPWAVGGLTEPWVPAGRIQNRGNVWLVQNPLPCLPCDKLGCEGHFESRSQCLDELSVQQVLAAVDQALAGRRVA